MKKQAQPVAAQRAEPRREQPPRAPREARPESRDRSHQGAAPTRRTFNRPPHGNEQQQRPARERSESPRPAPQGRASQKKEPNYSVGDLLSKFNTRT